MSEALDELVRTLAESIDQMADHEPWRVVTGDTWDKAGRDGEATAYVEVVLRYPDSPIIASEQLYLTAKPVVRSEVPT